ncbi:MAG: DMT family transporter [Candidatus Eisenbacteria bacterium]
MSRNPKLPVEGIAHLLVVYFVWGSTYLAIRIAVRDGGGGFPAFLLAASRTLVASAVLLGFLAIRGKRIIPTRQEAPALLASGILLWVGGNGLVTWAERHADSGYAALLVGTMPMWIAAIDSILDRRAPSPRLAASLLLGFGGLFVLTWPMLREGARADLHSVVALLVAPLSWGIGLVIQKRRPAAMSPVASSGILQLAGGLGLAALAAASGERIPHPSTEAWLAWGYLVAGGSLLAFTSFLRAVQLLPTRIVATYSYVNPVLAVFLGWLLLGETITEWTIAGTALILAGIAGTFHAPPPRIVSSLDSDSGRRLRTGEYSRSADRCSGT